MKQIDILEIVKNQSTEYYQQINDWIHGLGHVELVVKNAKKLAKLENFSPKDQMLLEMSAWLHDVGRVKEMKNGLDFKQSNHAEESYIIAKKMLSKFERKLGRENVVNVLLAVREHSLPTLKHPYNKIARLLQDADRTARFGYLGIFTMLTYFKVFDFGEIKNETMAKKYLPKAKSEILKNPDSINFVIEKLNILLDWYYGNSNQGNRGVKVAPLHSKSAKSYFKTQIVKIEKFIKQLKSV